MDTINIGPMDGKEVAPGVFLIGEPTPIPGTNKMRCLANVDSSSLCVVELALKFDAPLNASEQPLACAVRTSGTALDA